MEPAEPIQVGVPSWFHPWFRCKLLISDTSSSGSEILASHAGTGLPVCSAQAPTTVRDFLRPSDGCSTSWGSRRHGEITQQILSKTVDLIIDIGLAAWMP
jgi:hypothetical protein